MSKTHKTTSEDLRSRLLRDAPQVEAMEQLFEGLKDVMFSVKDLKGRYLCANKAFLLRVGIRSRSGIVGKTTREVFPLALAIEFERQDEEILLGKKGIYNHLDVVTNPDHSLGWYITDKVPVHAGKHGVVAIASTTRDLKLPANEDSETARIIEFVTTMQKRFREPIRISELAAKSGMSQSKLERKMRAIMSVTPRHLLTRIRVDEAAERLATTQDRLIDIAYDCGFCDQPTFCRQFKNLTGMTPLEYRQSKWKLARRG